MTFKIGDKVYVDGEDSGCGDGQNICKNCEGIGLGAKLTINGEEDNGKICVLNKEEGENCNVKVNALKYWFTTWKDRYKK